MFSRDLRFLNRLVLSALVTALAAGLCLGIGTLFGGDDAAPKKPTNKEVKKEQGRAEPEQKVVITGSLIPQKGKLNRIPVTSSPVIVISRTDIERSGATTLAEVLKRQGASR